MKNNDYKLEKNKLIFLDPLRYVNLYIVIRKVENGIGIFFDLTDSKSGEGGDCEIYMTHGMSKQLSAFLMEMVKKSKNDIIEEDNLRTIRFEQSDASNEKYPKGQSGNIIILACKGLIEIIIHFDDPIEYWDHNLSMKSQAAQQFAYLLQQNVS